MTSRHASQIYSTAFRPILPTVKNSKKSTAYCNACIPLIKQMHLRMGSSKQKTSQYINMFSGSVGRVSGYEIRNQGSNPITSLKSFSGKNLSHEHALTYFHPTFQQVWEIQNDTVCTSKSF